MFEGESNFGKQTQSTSEGSGERAIDEVDKAISAAEQRLEEIKGEIKALELEEIKQVPGVGKVRFDDVRPKKDRLLGQLRAAQAVLDRLEEGKKRFKTFTR